MKNLLAVVMVVLSVPAMAQVGSLPEGAVTIGANGSAQVVVQATETVASVVQGENIWKLSDGSFLVKAPLEDRAGKPMAYAIIDNFTNYIKFASGVYFDSAVPVYPWPNSVYMKFGDALFAVVSPEAMATAKRVNKGIILLLNQKQADFLMAHGVEIVSDMLEFPKRNIPPSYILTPTPIAASPTVTPTPTVVVNTPTPPAPDATATPTVTPTVQQTPTVDPNAIPVTWRSGRGDTVRYLNGSGQVVSENDNPVRVEVKSPLFGSEWDAGIYAGLNLQQGLEIGDTVKVTFTVTADKAAQVQVLLEENRGGTAGLYRLTNYDPATNAPPAVSVSAGTSRHTVTLTVREKNTKAVQLTFWVGHNPSTTVSIDMTTLEVLRQ